MLNKKYFGYLIAVITIIVYEFWYFGSYFITEINTSPIIPLLIVFLVSTLIAAILHIKEDKKLSLDINEKNNILYPILAGLFFAFGNYIFYWIINSAGIPAVSAFTTAEIIVFTFLLLLASKDKNSMSFLFIGSIFIAFGMILESLKIEYSGISIDATTLFFGVLIATLYGIATYFYYISLEKIKKILSTITLVSFTEFVILGLITLIMFLNKSLVLPNFNIYYILFASGIGLVLFFTAWLDATMMKVLLPFGKEAVATGYIISDMQLLPIIIYTIFIFPSTWYIYAAGLVLVIIGIILLDWL